MTKACADLDGFFDGEVGAEHAGAFRDHVAGCVRCQRVLHGRMQEAMVVDVDRDAGGPLAAAVGRKRRRVRMLAILVPVMSAVAVAVVTLTTRHPAPRTTALQVELSVDHTGPAMRGKSAHPGDVLRVMARGARHRAIWVYRNERTLVAVCPGATVCRGDDEVVGLDLVLQARGAYSVLSLGAASPLPIPSGTLDADLDAASTIEGSYQIGHIDVD